MRRTLQGDSDSELHGIVQRSAKAPGRRTLTQGLTPAVQRAPSSPREAEPRAPMAAQDDPFGLHLLPVQWPPVQRRLHGAEPDDAQVQRTAQAGVAGGGGALPHGETIQRAFGPTHDLSGVTAHVGGAAATASEAIGAEAYATGTQVAFRAAPDLHLAAHEAAHVIQQRGGVQLKGGVGAAGDEHERHADAVADRVVAGQSAAALLDQYAGGGGGIGAIQRKLRDAKTQAEITSVDLDHLDRETAQYVDEQVRTGAWTADPEDLQKIQRALQGPQPSSSGLSSGLEGGTSSGLVSGMSSGLVSGMTGSPLSEMELGSNLNPSLTQVGTGQHVATAMSHLEATNPASTAKKGEKPTAGVWYRGDFARITGELPEEFRNGWANPKFFKMPPAGRDMLVLLEGVSASAAVDAYFAGLTITECFSMVLATSYRALRDEWGPHKFDLTFGGVDHPVDRPLCIEGAATFSGKNPITKYLGKSPAAMIKGNRGTKDARPVEVGDFASFANHPDYSFKHPSGSAAFWNVVCVDATPTAQRWSGFGLGTAKSEDQIIELLMSEHNKEPTEKAKGEYVDQLDDPNQFQTGTLVKGKSGKGRMGFQPGDSKRLQATPIDPELKLVGEQSRMGAVLSMAAERQDDKLEKAEKERRLREFLGESTSGPSSGPRSREFGSPSQGKPISLESLRSFSTNLNIPKRRTKPTVDTSSVESKQTIDTPSSIETKQTESSLPPTMLPEPEHAHATTALALRDQVGPELASAVLNATLEVPFTACGHTWVLLERERSPERNDDCTCVIKRLD